MTSPQYAVTGRGGRFYDIPSPPLPVPFYGPSVTTVLSKGMPTGWGLTNWMKKNVAEYAYDNVDAWSKLERDAAVDLLVKEPDRQRDKAGDAGTDVHALCEKIMRGQPLGDWAAPYAGWINGFEQFLKAWHVEPLYMERTVVHTSSGITYAGSFDFVANIDGTIVLGDIKTSRNIYAKTGLQLASYACADLMLSDDGRASEPMVNVESLGILHLREDEWGWTPIDAPIEELFESFQAVHGVALFEMEKWREVMGRKPADPPRRDEYRAELRDRVANVIEWGGADDLAAAWPADVPTLKHDGHTTHQLDAIDYLLRRIEPTWRPKPPVASIDRHAQSIDLLDEIKDQPIFDTVQKYAVSVGIPNLHTATATVEQLDQLDRIVAAVTKAPDPEDRAARIGRATNGRTTSPAELTADDMPAFLRTRASKSKNSQSEGAAA